METDSVLIDANCLHKIYLRTLLLTLSDCGLLEPKWSKEIIAETIKSLGERFPKKVQEISQRFDQIDRHFRDASISGYSDLVGSFGCKDSGDEHVLAAAIKGNCNVLLTFNTGDFPKGLEIRYGLHVRNPDDYLLLLAERQPENFTMACVVWLKFFQKPKIVAEGGAKALSLAGCPRIGEWLEARAAQVNSLLR